MNKKLFLVIVAVFALIINFAFKQFTSVSETSITSFAAKDIAINESFKKKDIFKSDPFYEQKHVNSVEINGLYTSKDEVALYLHTFAKLPSNFITKKDARNLGWNSKIGNLWEVSDKKSIGGDRFGNREGKLPFKSGREWFECDINYNGGYRGAERIVFSNDGLIYYTKEDNYERNRVGRYANEN